MVRGFTPEQVEVITSGGETGAPEGPRLRLDVVGISRTPIDLTLQGEVGGILLLPRALVRAYGADIGNYYGPQAPRCWCDSTTARPGSAIPATTPEGPPAIRRRPPGPELRRRAGVIDAPAVAVLIFGIVAGVAGLVAIALITTREVRLVAAI